MKDSTFWNVTFARGLAVYANVIFVALWLGFFVALIVDKAWLDAAWDWAEGLPTLNRVVVWIMFLPVLVGLWIWESSWPMLGRLAGLGGMLLWTYAAVASIPRNFG